MEPISNQKDDTADPHETFLRLWMRHEPELRAFVRSCCPKAQEVDDVMQEEMETRSGSLAGQSSPGLTLRSVSRDWFLRRCSRNLDKDLLRSA